MTEPAAKSKRATKPEQPAAERKPIAINPGDVALAELRQTDWRITLPAGTEAADIHLNPDACALLGHLLSIGDRVTGITGDGRTMLLCVCVAGDRNSTATTPVLHVLQRINLPRPEEITSNLPAGFYLRPAQPGDGRDGWLCCRKRENDTDEIVMNSNSIFNRDEALQFLLSHPATRDAAGKGSMNPVVYVP
jgi:hypothetical protein